MTAPLGDVIARLASEVVTSEALVESVLTAGHGEGAVERPIARSRSLARASDARRHAGRSRGPLDGVPFGVKANFDVQGEPTTSGLTSERPPAASDARSVALLVAQGAVPTVVTTMAPAALGTVTPHPDGGLCQNPRDRGRGAGGSSGGSAAAVGSGLVPFALGSDTLGSVRIPAAHCGVVGWVPTHGTISTRGLVPLAPPLDAVGLLSAAASDLELLAKPLFEPDGPAHVPVPRPRIADCTLGERADVRGQQAAEALIEELVALGAVRTTTVGLAVEPRVVRRRALLLAEVCAAVTFREAREAGRLPAPVDTLVDYGARASGTRLWNTLEWLVKVRRLIRLWMRDVDYLVLPTTPNGAPPVGEDPESVADLTAWVNVAGLPSVALPVGDRSVQVVGRPGADLDLVRWAALLSSQLPKAADRLSMNAVMPSW